jgi:serine/threonine-protein kinase
MADITPPPSALTTGLNTKIEPDPNDPLIGTTIGGKYIVELKLGEGGMGIVYKGRHKVIGKRIAIKLLHSDVLRDPEVVERFKVEAQAAGAIGNEHIIEITDFDQLENGQTFFVMEYLDGKPLSKLFSDITRVPVERLAKIGKHIALGLDAAHEAGIIHRDLKPDNIYLCKRSGGETDFVKILDFGIAKVGQSGNKLTKAGAVFGTPHYMSPEQASGQVVDARTDIYALGVILYEGAVGRVPFDADNFMGILTQHIYKAPVPPRALPECPPDLPAGMELIIMRCLRKKPEERYTSMAALAEDLDRLMRGEVPRAASDMMALSAGYQSLAQSATDAYMAKPIAGQPPMSPRRSLPVVFGVSIVVAAAAVLAVVFVGMRSSSSAQSTDNKPTQSASTFGTPTASAAALPPQVTPSASASAPAASASVATRVVLVTSPTPGAHLFDGEKDLGDLPQNYELLADSEKDLVVRARGYQEKTIHIAPSSSAKLVEPLAPIVVRGPGGRPQTRRPGGGGVLNDPWR